VKRKLKKALSLFLALAFLYCLFVVLPVPVFASPLQIITQPVSREVAAGGSTSFTVEADSNTGTLFFLWAYRLHGARGPSSAFTYIYGDYGIFTGANTATLTLTNVTAEYDDYEFYCAVFDGEDGIFSDVVRLTVNPIPVRITGQPASQSVAEGSNATFTVAATGTATLSYTWWFGYPNGLLFPIPDSEMYDGVNTATLTVKSVPLSLNGYMYFCRVTNTESSVTKESDLAFLTVAPAPSDAPKIDPQPAVSAVPSITGPIALRLTAGYAATSTDVFTIAGTPAPTVEKISGDARITWDDAAKRLNIATGLEAGVYPIVLKASNGVSPDAELTFTLTVEAEGASGIGNFVRINTYAPGMYSDMDEDAWYGSSKERVVANAYEYGLVRGKTAATFDPTGNIKVVEAIALAARVHSIYTTGMESFTQGEPWYQVYADYALANGIIAANDFDDITRAATRAEMAYIFSRALPQSEFPELNIVNALPDVGVDGKYGDEIYMLYKAGILTGSDILGTFYPNNSITRAEAAGIISRVKLPDTRISGKTY